MTRTNRRRNVFFLCAAALTLSAACAASRLLPHGLAVRQGSHDLLRALRSARCVCSAAASLRLRTAVATAPAYAAPVPAAVYRISYRPVPTVAYMPVTSTDSCSGCAVTTYQPTRILDVLRFAGALSGRLRRARPAPLAARARAAAAR